MQKLTNVWPFILLLVDELGDFSAELKLSFFQLGISPQIIASIIMQVCNSALAIFYLFIYLLDCVTWYLIFVLSCCEFNFGALQFIHWTVEAVDRCWGALLCSYKMEWLYNWLKVIIFNMKLTWCAKLFIFWYVYWV